MGINYMMFNGIDSRDFDIYLFRKDILTFPVRSVKKVSIPGRNGDIIIDNKRYENVLISYSAVITRNAYNNLAAFRQMIVSASSNYTRLEDTFDRDEFYFARLNGQINPEATRDLDAVRMTITFDRRPQRYLKVGEEPITVSTSTDVVNPFPDTSFPIVKIIGNGSFSIGGRGVTVANLESTDVTFVDCENEDCRGANGENRNGNVTLSQGVFPCLVPGANAVTVSTDIDILPMWWRL